MKIISIEKQMMKQAESERYPFEERFLQGSAFIHGDYCSAIEASIPMIDLGFLQADAVYEKATVSNGRIFRLKDHLERFERSCEKFHLKNPHSNEETVEILSNLVRLTGLKNAGVYWCVTRGFGHSVKDRNNPDVYENRFYAIASPYGSIATDQDRLNGIDIIVSQDFIRIPPKAIDPTAKNFNGTDMKLSLFEARRSGKDWSVLLDQDDFLTEAPGANIFIVKNGSLYTPDSGCLEGITRRSVCDLAEIMGIPLHIEKVHVNQLRDADEAFLTSSAGGVMPIRSVDSIVLGDKNQTDNITTQLHNLYWQKMWDGWLGTDIDYKRGSSVTSQHKEVISE